MNNLVKLNEIIKLSSAYDANKVEKHIDNLEKIEIIANSLTDETLKNQLNNILDTENIIQIIKSNVSALNDVTLKEILNNILDYNNIMSIKEKATILKTQLNEILKCYKDNKRPEFNDLKNEINKISEKALKDKLNNMLYYNQLEEIREIVNSSLPDSEIKGQLNKILDENEKNYNDKLKEIRKIVNSSLPDSEIKRQLNNIFNYNKFNEIKKIAYSLNETIITKMLQNKLNHRKIEMIKGIYYLLCYNVPSVNLTFIPNIKINKDAIKNINKNILNNIIIIIDDISISAKIESFIKLDQNIDLVIKKLDVNANNTILNKLNELKTFDNYFNNYEKNKTENDIEMSIEEDAIEEDGEEDEEDGEEDLSSQIKTFLDKLKNVTNEPPEKLNDYIKYSNTFHRPKITISSNINTPKNEHSNSSTIPKTALNSDTTNNKPPRRLNITFRNP